VHVVLAQHIPYAICHRKMASSFKARPPKLATFGMGPAVPSHHQDCPARKGRRGCSSLWLLMPHHRLPGMKLPRRRLLHRWSCSPHPLCGGASSLAALSRRFGVSHGLPWPVGGATGSRDRCRKFSPLELWPVCAGFGCPHWDGSSSCRFSSLLKEGRPQLMRRLARHDSLHLGLVLLPVGRP
jgi:hypothetical protein